MPTTKLVLQRKGTPAAGTNRRVQTSAVTQVHAHSHSAASAPNAVGHSAGSPVTEGSPS